MGGGGGGGPDVPEVSSSSSPLRVAAATAALPGILGERQPSAALLAFPDTTEGRLAEASGAWWGRRRGEWGEGTAMLHSDARCLAEISSA